MRQQGGFIFKFLEPFCSWENTEQFGCKMAVIFAPSDFEAGSILKSGCKETQKEFLQE